MNIKKIIIQLDEFFDLSKKKQEKKQDKLLKIISSLKEKKSELKLEMLNEDKHSKRYHSMCKEFRVISKLIKKAKKHKVFD